MLETWKLAVYRWFALRALWASARAGSYAFIDYYVPYTGLHDRLIGIEKDGAFLVSLTSTDPLSTGRITVRRQVTVQSLQEVFHWIERRFSGQEQLLLSKTQWDPARLMLFARDANADWTSSIVVRDIHMHRWLAGIRDEIVEVFNK